MSLTPINTVEELLSDDWFLAWYFATDTKAVEKWNRFIAHDPIQQKLVNEAVQLLKTITINEQPVDAQRLKNAEQKLINSTAPLAGNPKIISMRSQRLSLHRPG